MGYINWKIRFFEMCVPETSIAYIRINNYRRVSILELCVIARDKYPQLC